MTQAWQCPGCGRWQAPWVTDHACGEQPQIAPQVAPQASRNGRKMLPEQPQLAGVVALEVQSTTNPKTHRKAFVYDDPGFLEFWSVYPLHLGKADAFRRWKQQIAAGMEPQAAVAAAARYAAAVKDTPPDKIKHAEGWLNGRRWEDDWGETSHVATPDEVAAERERRQAEEDERVARIIAEEA